MGSELPMSDDVDDEIDFEEGDYFQIKGTDEAGRVVGKGTKPGHWVVRLSRAEGEHPTVEVDETTLEHIY